jgi:hypothetical protein
MVIFTTRPLYSREKGHRYPFDNWLVASKAGLEVMSKKKVRESDPGRQARNLVTILTQLSLKFFIIDFV